MLVAEKTKDMVTNVSLKYQKQRDGFVNVSIEVASDTLAIDASRFIMLIVFAIIFLLNLYIFMSSEHNIYQRFLKWHQNNIAPLTKIEKDQREKKKPLCLQKLSLVFRPASVALIAHIILTLYTEALYILNFVELTKLKENIDSYPTAPVKAVLLDLEDGDTQDTRQTRQAF